VRLEVLTAVLVLWVVMRRGLVGRYRRFGGTYCLQFICDVCWRQCVTPKRWYIACKNSHGVTTHRSTNDRKTNSFQLNGNKIIGI
jgi:hypothetical protein